MHHFGTGLVRTPSDFGTRAEPPSHPELLDWLAVEFVNRGWSLKATHKLIVMSATYQQASRVSPELLVKDAENALLARGPRVRLDAEVIRDAALRASGAVGEKDNLKILTSCPSCLQGLSRYNHDLQNGLLEADYIVVEMANKILGPDWMKQYVRAANDGGIERVLV